MAADGLKMTVVAGTVLLVIGTVLHIVAMATPAWTVVDVSRGSLETGPWKICSNGVCVDVTETNSSAWDAVRAFTLLGALGAGGACVLVVLIMVMAMLGKSGVKLLPLLSMAAAAAACVCVLIGAIVWAAEIHPGDPATLGYSFALSLVGGVLVFLGGALVFKGGRAD